MCHNQRTRKQQLLTRKHWRPSTEKKEKKTPLLDFYISLYGTIQALGSLSSVTLSIQSTCRLCHLCSLYYSLLLIPAVTAASSSLKYFSSLTSLRFLLKCRIFHRDPFPDHTLYHHCSSFPIPLLLSIAFKILCYLFWIGE